VQLWGNVTIIDPSFDVPAGGAVAVGDVKGQLPGAANLTLGSTLKSLVRKCDILFNTQPVCSETNLHNYWDIKQ